MNKFSDYLQKARNESFALGAFNAGSLEIAQAIFAAAKQRNAPLIIEASPNEIKHFGMDNFLAVVNNYRRKEEMAIFTNLDHGQTLEDCQKAIEMGFDMVHFDGSTLPYEENVKIAKAVVDLAHQHGVIVEGEIDHIMGSSSVHDELPEMTQAKGKLTDPDQADDFFQRTGCDILAVFVGNLHGTFQTAERIDLNRLEQIKERVSGFLSLHGGSGLAPEDITAAIKNGGVVKVNINTELRVAFRETLENVLRGSDEAAIYKIMPPVMAAVQAVVTDKIEMFGSGNKMIPQDIPPITPSLD
jgi:ketose-bisphosphate aldolase